MPRSVVRKRGWATDAPMFSSIVRILTSGWFGSSSRTAARRALTSARGSPAVRRTTDTKLTGRTELETLAEGVLIGEVLARHRLIDHSDRGRALGVGVGEKAAAQQRDAEGLVEARGDRAVGDD